MNLADNGISGATVEYRSENYRFEKHLHTSMELYLINAGTCYMDIENTKLRCTQGDFVLVLPHVVHSFYLTDNTNCVFSHIHFEPDVFSSIMLSHDTEYPISLMNALIFSCNFYHSQKADQIIIHCINCIIELYQQDYSYLKSAEINLTLLRLCLHVLKICKDTYTTSHTMAQNSYIAFTLDYIKNHYMEKIHQADIAAELHISVRYLSKLFVKYMGISLSRYINIFRINQSIVLMKTTDMSLTEIALMLGLSSSQHLTKLFTDIINMTPSSYRKQFLTKK